MLCPVDSFLVLALHWSWVFADMTNTCSWRRVGLPLANLALALASGHIEIPRNFKRLLL